MNSSFFSFHFLNSNAISRPYTSDESDDLCFNGLFNLRNARCSCHLPCGFSRVYYVFPNPFPRHLLTDLIFCFSFFAIHPARIPLFIVDTPFVFDCYIMFVFCLGLCSSSSLLPLFPVFLNTYASSSLLPYDSRLMTGPVPYLSSPLSTTCDTFLFFSQANVSNRLKTIELYDWYLFLFFGTRDAVNRRCLNICKR